MSVNNERGEITIERIGIAAMMINEDYRESLLYRFDKYPETLSEAEKYVVKQFIARVRERQDVNSFFYYLKASGLNNKENGKILELGRGNPCLSEFMVKEGFNVYLLSENVDYSECIMKGIISCGHGDLSYSGIYIPEPDKSDLTSLFPSSRYPHKAPTIDEFDTIVIEGIYNGILTAMSFNKKNYVGFCGKKNEDLTNMKLEFYRHAVERLNALSNNQYVLANDSDSKNNMDYYLIKKIS